MTNCKCYVIFWHSRFTSPDCGDPVALRFEYVYSQPRPVATLMEE